MVTGQDTNILTVVLLTNGTGIGVSPSDTAEKLTPKKAKWLAERYYGGMEKRDPSMAKIFYTEDFVLQDDGAVEVCELLYGRG